MFQQRFEGGEQLARVLDGLSRRPQRAIVVKVLTEGAIPIQEMASSIAPVDPGAPDLAKNIMIAAVRSEEMGAVAVGPSPDFFYGLFQEEGTVHHRAQPFMRPAFDTTAIPVSLGVIGQAFWREVIERGLTSARTSPGSGIL